MSNPILILGPAGSGKTYIANGIAQWYPEPHIKRMTTEEVIGCHNPSMLKVYKLLIIENVLNGAEMSACDTVLRSANVTIPVIYTSQYEISFDRTTYYIINLFKK